MALTIKRTYTDKYTTGILTVKTDTAEFTLKTLELPYKENKNNISCIPAGEYMIKRNHSAKFGDCFKVGVDVNREIRNTKNYVNAFCDVIRENGYTRENILIHAGNSVVDFIDNVNYNWKCDSSGCILVGYGIEERKEKNTDKTYPILYDSKKALNILTSFLTDIDILTIE
jgi:hypothetical protein